MKEGKLRPALVLAKLPGIYNDWLICMISTKKYQVLSPYDEIIRKDSEEFIQSGLKTESVIRSTRLAVVNQNIFLGSIGGISDQLVKTIRQNIAKWILH